MTKSDGTSPPHRGVSRAQREFARLTRPPENPLQRGDTDSFHMLVCRREDLLQRLQWLSPGAGPLLRKELTYLSALIDLINAELAALKAADVECWGGPSGYRKSLVEYARANAPRNRESLRPLAAELRELGEDATADAAEATADAAEAEADARLLIGPAR